MTEIDILERCIVGYMIVWDTEFTSWKGCNENGWDESEGQYKELIQIGGYKIENDNYSVVDTIDIIVEPRINTRLSGYIQNLTGISQKTVENSGTDFIDALHEFECFCENEARLSWGDDSDILGYNLDLYNRDEKVENEQMYGDIRNLFRDRGIPCDQYTSGSVHQYYDIDAKIDQHYAVEDSLSMVLALQKGDSR